MTNADKLKQAICKHDNRKLASVILGRLLNNNVECLTTYCKK